MQQLRVGGRRSVTCPDCNRYCEECMLDIIGSTRTLTDTGLQPDQAAAITHVVQQAVERGDHV